MYNCTWYINVALFVQYDIIPLYLIRPFSSGTPAVGTVPVLSTSLQQYWIGRTAVKCLLLALSDIITIGRGTSRRDNRYLVHLYDAMVARVAYVLLLLLLHNSYRQYDERLWVSRLELEPRTATTTQEKYLPIFFRSLRNI